MKEGEEILSNDSFISLYKRVSTRNLEIRLLFTFLCGNIIGQEIIKGLTMRGFEVYKIKEKNEMTKRKASIKEKYDNDFLGGRMIMLKEKYNLSCLYPQTGGIYVIGLYKRYKQAKKECASKKKYILNKVILKYLCKE